MLAYPLKLDLHTDHKMLWYVCMTIIDNPVGRAKSALPARLVPNVLPGTGGVTVGNLTIKIR